MSGAKIALVGAVVIVGGVVIWKLASSSSPGRRVVPSNTDMLVTTGFLSGVATLFGKLSSAAPSGPGSGSSGVNTATSNYIADQTAAADSASGVVGFGGWT